ncbi:polyribonucleotide nucleotidyltransferase [Peptoclostridium litorale DSM 5388]|uniref:Polyribonucleotide nucleotidyltransferase n=1 Tax=Peptoclostridium litorale DSM 5388 TaxID=1121324 RepID=A0A069REK1_PEPLI|nr:polyribonucleotide nucleotidyltransferase [Peptoclostridium litorale]KDR95213.1 polyribonucleotide nucleotidyltransferase Pnp [Peptoclostridium litorale DSM 5388]SIN73307.1 polyribonucleotide nucleotidyltransferase [Peptoclostridium litorale DSM 5388]
MYSNYEMNLAGRTLTVEIGKVAELADGSCILRYGDTVILATVCASKEPKQGIDFFPLSVDYEEKSYAVGKIPGGFIKREGRPSERAVLTSRLIDRPIRPLFPKGYRNDVQVITKVLSVDQDCNPDIVAMIGSSIALSISSVPFQGPTGSVSVGVVDGELVLNPNREQRENSKMYLVVSGTKDAIMMVEAAAEEVSEEVMTEAIMYAHEEIKNIVSFIEDIAKKEGKEKQEYTLFKVDEEIEKQVWEFAEEKMLQAIKTPEKLERQENIDKVKAEVLAHFEEKYGEEFEGIKKGVSESVGMIIKKQVRMMITKEGIRPDNRGLEEIRPIWSEIAVLPRTHGSALFTRGQTQALTIATLGALGDVQILDGLDEKEEKRYMHHYNFPPFSTGEARFLRGPGRREIGHGALAEKALEPMIPSKEEFPYAIRLVSEILSSNGSSSMASVCGSTLSLMDAGVPLKKMVSGIAMGLIKEDDSVAVLSDIQGMEDFLGDMDFKVAGTKDGITAIQMDMKIHGIDRDIIKKALNQAKDGRMFIMGKMQETITAPKEDLSPYAPRIIQMIIDTDKIRDVIGPGGKVITKIIEETGVKMDIENDGRVFITAEDLESGNKAKAMVENIVKEPEVGEVYKGKVTRLMKFGAFIEILPGKEGLVHISNIAHERIEKVEDVLKVGDAVDVKLMEIDEQGRINLSIKALIKK